MIHATIQPYLPQVVKLLEKHKIKNAYVFGSVISDKFNEQSDIDFLVNLQEGLDPVEAGGHLWDLIFELEFLLNRKVDLLTERSLKNPFFIEELKNKRVAIYG